MMSVQPKPQMTFDSWLAAERAALEGRSEYVRGEVFAMTGGSEEHNLIVANVVRELGNRFKGQPCLVYPSDMRVHIAAEDVGAYPDVMAVCGDRQFLDERRDTITNPTLIVEVLSESTEAYDRGDKFAHYRSLPSLMAYLLISQSRIRAELFVRQANDTWNLSIYSDLADEVPLAAVDSALPLAEVYDKLDLSR
jgi:Uma2 family endonuclease